MFQSRGKSATPTQTTQSNNVGTIQMKVSNPRPSLGNGVAQMKVSKKELPPEVQIKMEDTFNTDFSNVQIGESQQVSDMGALAYAQGNQINFAPGQFKPNTESGQKLLGHELTHIVQQRQGQVKTTGNRAGMPVNEDTSLEQEADMMGEKAAKNNIDATPINVGQSAQLFTLGTAEGGPKRKT